MYVSSGASNSVSSPSGPISFTLYTAMAEALNGDVDLRPNDLEMVLTDPIESGIFTILDFKMGGVVWRAHSERNDMVDMFYDLD